MKYYKEVSSELNFSQEEEEVLQYWNKNKIFEQSVDSKRGKEFVFYDGPPFANGLPHYGHLLTGFIKDTFARYHTMLGSKVERRFGWDCHGLPAEMGAEKELKISGTMEIEKFGIEKFNNWCKNSVMKFSTEWEGYVTRQARWVDFKNDYKTMNIDFMESILWAFKTLFDKGLVYESFKVVPYSWACETPLSNFETRLDNSYRKKESKAVTLKCKMVEMPQELKKYNLPCYILVWTTTPWTLPSNLAIAINENIQYKALIHEDEIHIAGSF